MLYAHAKSGVKSRNITNMFEYKSFSFSDCLPPFVFKLKKTVNFIKTIKKLTEYVTCGEKGYVLKRSET